MKKAEIKKYLKQNCIDFLNFEKGERAKEMDPDEYFEGFYIEFDDVADLFKKLMKK